MTHDEPIGVGFALLFFLTGLIFGGFGFWPGALFCLIAGSLCAIGARRRVLREPGPDYFEAGDEEL